MLMLGSLLNLKDILFVFLLFLFLLYCISWFWNSFSLETTHDKTQKKGWCEWKFGNYDWGNLVVCDVHKMYENALQENSN